MRRSLPALLVLAAPLLGGCPSAPPPLSQLPSAQAAIDRMHATTACGTGVQASAKIDHFGKQGRVRGNLDMIVTQPARIRMDVFSFGVAVATLTSDGKAFALADLRDKRFYVGRASACNIARLTTVPIPGPVLVDLLRGQAPVVKHAPDPAAMKIEWSGDGYYKITVVGTRDAVEEIHVTPRPDDFAKPWAEQRMRVLDVTVRQQGLVLYHAALDEHAPARTASPRVDSEGIDPPIPPSGPSCDAEIPRTIHVEVPGLGDDVLFRYEQVVWNPPIPEGLFVQQSQAGMSVTPVSCQDDL
jgi:hypothetical protein